MYLHSFYVPENDKGHKNRLAYNPICFLSPNEQQNHLHVLWIGSGRYWCVLDDFELKGNFTDSTVWNTGEAGDIHLMMSYLAHPLLSLPIEQLNKTKSQSLTLVPVMFFNVTLSCFFSSDFKLIYFLFYFYSEFFTPFLLAKNKNNLVKLQVA